MGDLSGAAFATAEENKVLSARVQRLEERLARLEQALAGLGRLADPDPAAPPLKLAPTAGLGLDAPGIASPAVAGPAIVRTVAKARGERHAVAVIGVRGHGRKHIENFLDLGNCRIAYICDVDEAVGESAAAYVQEVAGYRPKVVQDFRAALDDPGVEAVSIATPHHWHALAAIWALQAGKHVYLEKPISHTLAEGESILAAARKYGRVVQCGTQLRSNTSLQAAGEFIRSGKLGPVKLVHCIVYKLRPPISKTPAPPPASVDYDLWCGPASAAPPRRGRFHYSWHWFWEYGNGALGNNGVHRVDAARIGMGLKGFGDRTLSFGGRFGPDDGGETPNTQIALHRFGETWILQEVFGLDTPAWKTVKNGIIFYGADNMIIYHKGAATLCDRAGKVISRFDGGQGNHYADFIRAVETEDPAQVSGDLWEGHVSSGLCHLGNISFRLGKKASDPAVAEAMAAISAPRFAADTLVRVRAHLTKHAEFGALTLGRPLTTDPATGAIQGDPEALALTARQDRPPYVVPPPDQV